MAWPLPVLPYPLTFPFDLDVPPNGPEISRPLHRVGFIE